MSGFAPTGTVTYTLYPGSTCTGTPLSSAQTVSLSGGEVPNSATTGALGAGAYSFAMAYGGDANYDPPTDSCEPFVVGKATPSASTQVIDAATYSPWSADEVTGARAYDTATLVGVSGFTPTGTVTYTLYPGTTCTGAPLSSAQTVSLSGGEAPNSATTGALGAGAYSFAMAYGGDANYGAASNSCRPFVVGKATPSASTQVIDAATSSPWSANEVTGARLRHRHRGGRERLHPDGHRHLHALPRSHLHGHAPLECPDREPLGRRGSLLGHDRRARCRRILLAMAYGGDANYPAPQRTPASPSWSPMQSPRPPRRSSTPPPPPRGPAARRPVPAPTTPPPWWA